jgi:MFS family permease
MDDADNPSYRSLLAEPPLLSVLGMLFAGIVGLQAVPIALPSVATALSVPDERVGLVVTAFFAAAAVTLPFVGAVADMFGRRRVALVSLAAYGTTGLATPFVGGFPALLVLRALQGAAFPGLVPLSVTLAGDLYAGTRGSMAQGLRISASGLAAAVTPTVAGVLAGIAWFYPFLLYALAFPVLAFALFFLPETGRGSDSGSAAADDDARPGGTIQYVRDVAFELRDANLLVLVVGAFAVFFGRYAVMTFLPLYVVRELGGTTATGGLLLSLVGASRIAVPMLSGRAVAWLSRKRVLLGALAGTAGSIALLPLFPALSFVGAVAVAYGASTALFVPVLNATVTSMAAADQRASVVNTMELGKIVALSASPAFFGAVLGVAGFTAVFVLAGALLGAYAVVAGVLLDGAALRDARTEAMAD